MSNPSKLIKEHDHDIAKYKLAKKKKFEFGVGHDKLTEELEKLTKTHKVLWVNSVPSPSHMGNFKFA